MAVGIRYDRQFVDLFAKHVDAWNAEFVHHIDLPWKDGVEIYYYMILTRMKKLPKPEIPMFMHTFLSCLEEELSDGKLIPRQNVCQSDISRICLCFVCVYVCVR